ncbi:hypothetical protein CLOSCI_00703 [[Clostridium] scindens ATCC 35704]|nr:hypothetical protein CLOSCI_00703 [[Clostridium] scindens ATCC 35704]
MKEVSFDERFIRSTQGILYRRNRFNHIYGAALIKKVLRGT